MAVHSVYMRRAVLLAAFLLPVLPNTAFAATNPKPVSKNGITVTEVCFEVPVMVRVYHGKTFEDLPSGRTKLVCLTPYTE